MHFSHHSHEQELFLKVTFLKFLKHLNAFWEFLLIFGFSQIIFCLTLTLETKLFETLDTLDFLWALLEYINVQLKNGDGQVSGII
jgi:hypothetical protein